MLVTGLAYFRHIRSRPEEPRPKNSGPCPLLGRVLKSRDRAIARTGEVGYYLIGAPELDGSSTHVQQRRRTASASVFLFTSTPIAASWSAIPRGRRVVRNISPRMSAAFCTRRFSHERRSDDGDRSKSRILRAGLRARSWKGGPRGLESDKCSRLL